MKKLELNISERLFALKYLDDFKGSVSMLGKILENVKQFGVSEEEWVKAGKVETKKGDDIQWTWNDEKGGLKSIEVDEDVVKYLDATIKKIDKEQGFGLADKAVVGLMTKLEVSLK